MSCSCRKGIELGRIKSEEIEELLKFLKKNPEAFLLILEVVNSFRPTDPPKVKLERLFLAVKDMLELGLLPYSKGSRILRILENFFLENTDKQRGNFLEILVSRLGPFTFSGRFRRVNQCKVFRGRRKLSDKEIDVAFSGKEVLELHECKANMVRQWRDPLVRRTKRGSKLHFLNSLPSECRNGKKVIPCCSGLDGEMGVEYVKLVFKFYGFRRIKTFGREDFLDRFLKKS